MNFKYTALLALLVMGNSLTAMEQLSESSEEESSVVLLDEQSTPEPSFWSTRIARARQILQGGARVVSDTIDQAQDFLDGLHNEKLYEADQRGTSQEFAQLLKHPRTNVHYSSKHHHNHQTIWIQVRMKLHAHADIPWQALYPGRYREYIEKYELFKAYEEALRAAGKLTDFDMLLRALVEKNNAALQQIIDLHANSPVDVFDINGHDVTGYTAIGLAVAFNPSAIPLLCACPNFDANTLFRHDYFIDASPVRCALMTIGVYGSRSEETNQIIVCLAEKGGLACAPEIAPERNYPPDCLHLALGVVIPEELRYRAEELRNRFNNGQPLNSLRETAENLACCYRWAVDGQLYLEHTEIKDRDRLTIDDVYDRTPGYEANSGNYMSHEGMSFKEFLKAQLRNDWSLVPEGVNGPDSLGMTPLMWAAARGNLELAQFLTEFQALDLAVVDSFFGFTALHFALRNGHTDMVRFLIELPGRHRTKKTKSGLSPYALAQRCKRAPVIEFLNERNKRRLHLLKCLKLNTALPLDILKKLVSELKF